MSSQQRAILPKPPGDSSGYAQTLPPGAGNPSSKKRSIIGVACAACQTRRTKCDGARPVCYSCGLKWTPCHYEVPSGLTRSAARNERIEKLEADNATMVEILWFLQTKSAEAANDFLQFIRTGSVDVHSMRQWLKDRIGDGDGLGSPPIHLSAASINSLDDGSHMESSEAPSESASRASMKAVDAEASGAASKTQEAQGLNLR
ncbi:hypothetical protein P152DRAFT_94555 [Eremomyces bilateralis CBS 781.70]|uniref:Zn(2)-C6 fungal-type domain-containing protein n=1 Tax=Eremomyces bilateralis CBS 781.70 TaxID=1392243 RepID=A0A6G1FX77_9PEZI|nr:uncharacterized protein P152DRAFT_94555 [Eremomyces bilateralis CBS 781.70]KAF1810312.1 hypothetical protein P152DRAFT_94555 [Eremomyces bilateralis CBS 781.70]